VSIALLPCRKTTVKVTPEDDPNLAGRLNNLGTGKMENLEQALRVTQQTVKVTPEDHPDLVLLI
jgi:hypothetical protein